MGDCCSKNNKSENEIKFIHKNCCRNEKIDNDKNNDMQKNDSNNQPIKEEIEEIFNNNIENNNKNYESSNKNNVNDNMDILDISSQSQKEEIYVSFIINEAKELYLIVKLSSTFNDVIKNLQEKYQWLQYYEEKMIFIYKNQKIDRNKTINDLGIKDNDIITITAG